jgi:hypothetical protein
MVLPLAALDEPRPFHLVVLMAGIRYPDVDFFTLKIRSSPDFTEELTFRHFRAILAKEGNASSLTHRWIYLPSQADQRAC